MYESLPEGTVALVFSGHAPRKTSDENYPFYADRNFVYLTGIEKEDFILMAEKSGGQVKETMFILPPDLLIERWNGSRLKENEVVQISGVENIRYRSEFDTYFHRLLRTGKMKFIALDLFKHEPGDRGIESLQMKCLHEFKRSIPQFR